MLVQSADTVNIVYDGCVSMLGFSFPIDINECTRNNGMCEDTCENLDCFVFFWYENSMQQGLAYGQTR